MIRQNIFPTLIIVLLFSFCGCNAQTSSQNNSLKLITTIPLPNVKGRIDHLTYDSSRHFIFVAALGNNTVEVVDLKKKKVTYTINDQREPQGIVYIPSLNKLVVANGEDGTCVFYSGESLSSVTSINLKDDADNVRYDAATQLVYVGYGNGGIAIINAVTMKQTATIPLDGHPEAFQLDKPHNRIYINVPDANEIQVADLTTHKGIANWKNIGASYNFPMALDEKNNRLFVACRHPSKLRIVNIETGKDVVALPCSSDPDDVFYNSIDSCIYLSAGDGYVDVFKQINANTYTSNGKAATHSGARTALFIPEINQLIVASPAGISGEAKLMVYSIK